jgi:hypothetical protein
MPYKNVDDFELYGPHTLAELVKHIAPLTYRCWARSKPPAPRPVISDQVNVDSLLDWTPGSPIRLKGTARCGRREAIFGRLSGYVRDVLASPRYTVTGIGPAGTPLDVPCDLANQLVTDLEHNILSTMDGGAVWRGVTVRTAPAAAGGTAAKDPSVSPSVGRRREWDWDAAMAHLTAVAATRGGLPGVQAEAERIVEKYFSDRHEGNSPASSGIRDKVGKVYNAIAQIKAKQAQKRGV